MITVEVEIKAPIEKNWEYWTNPEHIVRWYQASEDWHAPYAENDLKVNGTFKTTMAAKDGSFSFDLEGHYTEIIPMKLIRFSLTDQRKVEVMFSGTGDTTIITENFDPESENSHDLQKAGWQAILNSFKHYVENN